MRQGPPQDVAAECRRSTQRPKVQSTKESARISIRPEFHEQIRIGLVFKSTALLLNQPRPELGTWRRALFLFLAAVI